MSAVATGELLESFSPVTGRRLGAVEATAPGDVQRVVDEVAQVQPIWARCDRATAPATWSGPARRSWTTSTGSAT